MAYEPWTYAPRSVMRDRDRRDFRENASFRKQEEDRQAIQNAFDRFRSKEKANQDAPDESWFDRALNGLEDLGRGTLEAGGKIGSKALEALDIAGDYSIRPAFAVATGQLTSERRVDPKTGQAYREEPDFGDVGSSLKRAFTQNPIDTFRQAQTAYDETMRNPDLSLFGMGATGSRALTETVTDPSMYVPAGTVGRLATRLPQGAIRSALTARNSPIGALAEGAGRAGAGIALGSAAGAELGERSGLPGGEFVGQLAGGLAGGAAASRALRNMKGPVLQATEDTPGIRMRDDIERIPHEQITERPDLFQGRDADPGKSFGEAKVRQIVEDFDPMKLEPGLVAHDTSTDSFVVIRGHHRLEAQKRLASTGEIPAEGTWQVVDADLSDPAVVRQLRRQALESNYTTSKTNLREDVRLARTVLEDGGSTSDIRRSGRFSGQYAADLGYLATLPDDVLDEVVRRNAPHDLVAEIMRVARQVDLDDGALRGLINRFAYTEGKTTITRTALKETLEEHSALIKQAREAQMASRQMGMFDLGEFQDAGLGDSFLEDLDLIAQMKTEGARELRRWKQALAQIGELDDPGVAAARRQVEDAIGQRMNALQSMEEGARGRLEANASGGVPEVEGGIRQPDQGAPAGVGDSSLPGQRALDETPAEPVASQREEFARVVDQFNKGLSTDDFLTVNNYVTRGTGREDVLRLYARGEPFREWLRSISPDGRHIQLYRAEPGIEQTPAIVSWSLDETAARSHARTPDTEMQSRLIPIEDVVMPGATSDLEVLVRGQGAEPTAATQPELAATRSAAALGQPPGQQTGTPPGTPPIEPGAPSGTGGQQPFGSPDRPLFDALDAPDVSRARRQFEGNLTNKVDQKIRSALGRMKDETVSRVVDPILDAKRRVDTRMTHFVESRVDLERAAMRLAGLEIRQADDGTYHLFANGNDLGFAEDVVEQTSDAGRAAFQSLTPEQQSAIGMIAETNRLTNETMQAHGGQAPIDESIEGEYFGRVALGRQYENITGGTSRMESSQSGVSRSVGANRIKSRTHEAIEEGIAKGIDYSNPWDARAVRLRGKLLTAEDAWLKKTLGSLAVKKPESTLGLDTVKGHPAFNNKWFTPAVARRIQAGLDRPQRFRGATAINSVLTPLRSSFDMSAPLQQGLRLWLTDPGAAANYWWSVMRSLGDPKVYDGTLLRLNAEGPGLDYLAKTGLRYTGDAAEGEFLMPRALLDRAGRLGPAGRGVNTAFTKSNQAFSRTLNLYRLHFANSQYQRLVAAGLEGADLDEAMRQSNRGINRMFGWTETSPTSVEAASVFAPRYTRASIETLVKAISDGGIEGGMARRHMALLMAEGAAVVFLLNELRGHETEWDPTSSNFLRIRDVGGLDISPFGTYNTLFRAIAQGVMGSEFGEGNPAEQRFDALKRFGWGKMSPAMKLVYEPFIEGSTYLGRPQDILGDPVGVAQEQLLSSLPFSAQNLREEGPLAGAIGAVGVSASPVTPAEKRDFRRDELARERFGKSYDELSGADKSRINEDPGVAGHQAEADRNTLTREGDRSRATGARLEHARKVDELSAGLQRGEISGSEWREQYHTLQAELRGAMDVLDIGGGRDKDVDGWFELFDQAEMPDGRVDWELLEGLQVQYAREHPGIEEKVDRATGTQDNEVLRQYREARDMAAEYYAMPAYRGMELADSRRAAAILQAANSMVAYGYARDRDRALRQLRETDPEGVRLAQFALRRGTNPERQRWRRDPAHRTFALFYGDFTTEQVA